MAEDRDRPLAEPEPGPEAGVEPDTAVAPDDGGGDEPRPDPEREARRAAALSVIRRFGDPVLKSRATEVDRFDEALHDQVARMGALMGDAMGVGLAGPQLGVAQRVLVYRLGPDAPLITLVNPEVEWSSDELETMEEGCLSIPAVQVDVERAIHVRVGAVDERGSRRLVEASGLEARVIQHEIDHLDGVLILDRVSREERKEAMRAMREAEREPEAA
ncbi:MAG TPA: peptide deformylase [Thermoleophilaceae bacterium]|nr:peptide deformylase [Thermoleophilaceae bacterium]